MNSFFRNLKVDRDKARDTGLAMVLLLLILSWWLDSSLYSHVGAIILVLSMTIPRVFMPLAYLWFGLAHLLGGVVSRILLFIVYAIVVTPVGLIRAMAGKDPLKLKDWKTGNGTVFRTRNHTYSASDIEKPY